MTPRQLDPDGAVGAARSIRFLHRCMLRYATPRGATLRWDIPRRARSLEPGASSAGGHVTVGALSALSVQPLSSSHMRCDASSASGLQPHCLPRIQIPFPEASVLCIVHRVAFSPRIPRHATPRYAKLRVIRDKAGRMRDLGAWPLHWEWIWQ